MIKTGLETTSKLGEQSEQRVWEKGPADLSIAGEENPVISTNKKNLPLSWPLPYCLFLIKFVKLLTFMTKSSIIVCELN